jgi:hypothetical protein
MMEGQQTEQSQKQSKLETQEVELKEYLNRGRFSEMLSQWVNAIDNRQDFQVVVANRSCSIPAQALDEGKMRVEYEEEEGEIEFQLTLKWKGPGAQSEESD